VRRGGRRVSGKPKVRLSDEAAPLLVTVSARSFIKFERKSKIVCSRETDYSLVRKVKGTCLASLQKGLYESREPLKWYSPHIDRDVTTRFRDQYDRNIDFVRDRGHTFKGYSLRKVLKKTIADCRRNFKYMAEAPPPAVKLSKEEKYEKKKKERLAILRDGAEWVYNAALGRYELTKERKPKEKKKRKWDPKTNRFV